MHLGPVRKLKNNGFLALICRKLMWLGVTAQGIELSLKILCTRSRVFPFLLEETHLLLSLFILLIVLFHCSY